MKQALLRRLWVGLPVLVSAGVGGVLLPVAVPGCVSVHAGGGTRAAASLAAVSSSSVTDSDDARELRADAAVWPERWGDGDPGVGKGVVVPLDGPLDAWSPRRHGPWHARVPRGGDLEQVEALASGRAGEAGYRFRMEGYGAFVFERDPDIPAPDEDAEIGRSEPAMLFAFVSGRPAEDAGDAGDGAEPHIEVERTWFAFYDHRRGGAPEAGDPGLGTVMLLPGLFGIPEPVIDLVTSAMRQRGWNVIRMLAPPSRFVEKTEIELDPDDPASPAEAAGVLMHRIAETAYAAEGAWGHVLGERPDLGDLPKVVFGGSGGAMALPAVVRREPDRYDGAVVIAGGANILEIVSMSTYTKPVDALDFAWAGFERDETPPGDVIKAFAEAYLEHAPLDGYFAGEWFGETPTLIVQAAGDRAVPVENSELQWSRLGEPEKWTINGNHLTLFMSLWLHTPRILDWMDAAVLGRDEDGERP